MWAFSAEALADWLTNLGGWSGCPPTTSDGVCRRSYLCRACQVHGVAPNDDSLTCWCCGSVDDLVMDKGPGMASPHSRRASVNPPGFGPLEEVATLVG